METTLEPQRTSFTINEDQNLQQRDIPSCSVQAKDRPGSQGTY